MRRACILLTVVALAVASCRRGDALGDLRYFPGATFVGSSSFVGEAYGFPRAAWEQVELRTEAPYPRVRDFYAQTAIGGWTSTFESEATKSDGRVFSRYLADARRKQFYVITVEERVAARSVSVFLRRGAAR